MIEHNGTNKDVSPRNRTRTVVATVTAAALLSVGAITGPASGSDGSSPRHGRFRLFQHDTSQADIDLGAPGRGVGDLFIFGGDIFDRQGGTLLGRSGAQCATTSDKEMQCTATLALPDGQIVFVGLFDTFTFFTSNPVDFAITGGTGRYRKARGTVTVRILPDAPSDADVVVDLE